MTDKHNWSAGVTRDSHALEIQEGIFTWDDPTESTQKGKIMVKDTFEMVEKMTYPDSFIIQFPEKLVKGPELPYFLGGDKENPAYLWKWNADTLKTVEMNSIGLNKNRNLKMELT